MRKKIVTILAFLIIFMLACSVLFNDKDKNKDLVKVKIADTTLTSRTYMS